MIKQPLLWLGILASVGAWGAEEASSRAITSFGDVMRAGGYCMQVIVLLSVFAVFLVAYFLLTLRWSVLMPGKFTEAVMEAARDGDAKAFEAACRDNPCVAARILGAAADHITVIGRMDYLAVRDAVQEEGSRQGGLIWQRLQYLMDVAAVAPMVGLLGTVFGMLQSFAGLRTEVGAVRPDTLAQGVAKALITTAGGLVVGVAALMLYSFFRGRVNGLLTRLEEQCGLALRLFAGNYDDKKS